MTSRLQEIKFYKLGVKKVSKGPGKQGHIVADTLLPTQMFPRLPARATFVADTNFVSGTHKCFWFCSETFCVRNKCFPVCAAQETSWATMCPQQCVLVYQGLKVVSKEWDHIRFGDFWDMAPFWWIKSYSFFSVLMLITAFFYLNPASDIHTIFPSITVPAGSWFLAAFVS